MKLTDEQRARAKKRTARRFTNSQGEQFFIESTNGAKLDKARGGIFAFTEDGARYGAFETVRHAMTFLESI